jgi:hypothetical protein
MLLCISALVSLLSMCSGDTLGKVNLTASTVETVQIVVCSYLASNVSTCFNEEISDETVPFNSTGPEESGSAFHSCLLA